MPDKILWNFIVVDFLFLLTGGLILGSALLSEDAIVSTQTAGNAARDLLLAECPLTGVPSEATKIGL